MVAVASNQNQSLIIVWKLIEQKSGQRSFEEKSQFGLARFEQRPKFEHSLRGVLGLGP